MKFKKVTDEYYPDFYIDESSLYSIGLDTQMYGRMKIQVMFRDSLESNWYVIREYTSYEPKCIIQQLKEIFEKLEIISFDGKIERGWEEIEMILPPNDKKYLEDNYEQRHKRVFKTV